MTRTIRCLSLLSLAGTLGACEATDTWQPYRQVETQFEVLFPGAPEDKVESQSTAFGMIDTFIVELQPEGDPQLYRVRADVYPGPILGLGDSTSLIFARQKRYEHEIEGKATSAEDVELGAHRGRAFTFEYPDGRLEFARIFMVDTTMYHASVFTPKEGGDSAGIQKFLDSLRLPDSVAQPAAAEPAPAPAPAPEAP